MKQHTHTANYAPRDPAQLFDHVREEHDITPQEMMHAADVADMHQLMHPDVWAWDRMMDAIEAALYTFQWANPDRGDANRGELYVDRETRKLHLTVWVRDNEDPDNEDLLPLDVVHDVVLDEDPREQIRSLIHGFLRHEADEQMWFDGERPFYPHHEHEQGAAGGSD